MVGNTPAENGFMQFSAGYWATLRKGCCPLGPPKRGIRRTPAVLVGWGVQGGWQHPWKGAQDIAGSSWKRLAAVSSIS
eukprot:15325992-Alexandrium_andersonii.AAC.1